MKDFDLDLSGFEKEDFEEMMKAIKKVGMMQWLKEEMGEKQHGEEEEGEVKAVAPESKDQFQQFLGTDDFDEKTQLLDDLPVEEEEEVEEVPKKKSYTMFSVSASPKSSSAMPSAAKKMVSKLMGK